MVRFLTKFTLAFLLGVASFGEVLAQSSTEVIDTQMAKLFRLDFAVPDHPAFNIMGNNPDVILRPSGSEILSVVYSNFLSGKVPVVPKDFSAEFSFAQLFMANKLKYEDFNTATGKYNWNFVLKGIRMSVGTHTTENADALRNFALGLRIPLLDKGDLRTDTAYKREIINALTHYRRSSNQFDEKVWMAVRNYIKAYPLTGQEQLVVDSVNNYIANSIKARKNVVTQKAKLQSEIDSLTQLHNALVVADTVLSNTIINLRPNERSGIQREIDSIKRLSSKIATSVLEKQTLQNGLSNPQGIIYSHLITDGFDSIRAMLHPTSVATLAQIVDSATHYIMLDYEGFLKQAYDMKHNTRTAISNTDSLYSFLTAQIRIRIDSVKDESDSIGLAVNKVYNNFFDEVYTTANGRSIAQIIDSKKEEYKKLNWNKAKVDFAAALRFTTPDSLFSNLRYTKTNVWLTYATPIVPKNRFMQLVTGLQFSNERFDSLKVTPTDSTLNQVDSSYTYTYDSTSQKYNLSRLGIGLRIYVGINGIKGFIEGSCSGEFNHNARLGINGGLEWRITDGVWLMLSGNVYWQKNKSVSQSNPDKKVWEDSWAKTSAFKVDFRFNIPEKFKLF